MMNQHQPVLKTSSWESVWEVVRSIVPSAIYLTPGSLLLAAEAAEKKFEFLHAERTSDKALTELSLADLVAEAKPNEAIFVIADRCFLPGCAPFVFLASYADSFAQSYFKQTGEHVVSGNDLVLVFKDSKVILVWHHEGHIALVR